jgi:hypothetical protein
MIAWLEASALATWARQSPSIWAYPTILTLHTVGLGIVVGASAVVDLRLLGFAPRLRLGTLASLFTLLAWGFVLNAASGFILFIADATTKSVQPIFYVKLGLIVLALWATVLLRRTVRADERGVGSISARDRWLAGFSLLLWAGAITAGRLMAYF